MLTKIKDFFKRKKLKLPKKSLIILPIFRECWWHMGSRRYKPAMQVHGMFNITNISELKLYLLEVRIKGTNLIGNILIMNNSSGIFSQTNPILPGYTTKASISFWIIPPTKKTGKDLKITIKMLDQFGIHHQIKKVVFKNH